MRDIINLMQKRSLKAANRRVSMLLDLARGKKLSETANKYEVSTGRATQLVRAACWIKNIRNTMPEYSMANIRANSFTIEAECLNALSEIAKRELDIEKKKIYESSELAINIKKSIKLLKKHGYKVSK